MGFAIALAALLFCEEFLHYVIATDVGATDMINVAAHVHPQCKEIAGTYDLTCPFQGFNSVELECLGVTCSIRNPNVPPITEATRHRTEALDREDSIASLRVEAPYSAKSSEWQQHKIDLMTKSASIAFRGDPNQIPSRPEEAWAIIQGRSLNISRQTAQEWLNQHAK